MVFIVCVGQVGNRKYLVLGSLGILLTEIGRLFFVHTRRHRSTKDHMTIGRMLLCVWKVRSEYNLDPNNSPLEHIASVIT